MFSQIYEELIRGKVGQLYKPDWRVSSLPRCQVELFLGTITKDKEPLKKWLPKKNQLSEFYLEIGSGVHNVIQKWGSKTPYLLGNWKCWNCKRVYSEITPQVQCCGRGTQYQEVEFQYSVGSHVLTGHADGIIAKDGKIGMIELKTKKTEELELLQQPMPAHEIQLRCYASMAKIQYGLKIDELWWHYQSRESHKKYKQFKSLEINDDVFNKQIEAMKNVQLVMETGDVGKLVKNCKVTEYEPCYWQEICKQETLEITLLNYWAEYTKCQNSIPKE